jgi:NAD(P)-dependent dehydrogenase (short-subunit alcohol dehydrogenase family)
MSTFKSIREFVSNLAQTTKKLNVALLNAGIAAAKYEVSPDGWESALQVNVLGTALLTLLLVPMLRETASKEGIASQVTFTGSAAHRRVKPADIKIEEGKSVLETVNGKEFFNLAKSYMIIKLLGMYMMRGVIDDFSRNEEGELDVLFNVVCPGYCRTDLGREMPWYINLPTRMVQVYYGRTAEEGGRSLVSATLLGREGLGKYWTNDVFTE